MKQKSEKVLKSRSRALKTARLRQHERSQDLKLPLASERSKEPPQASPAPPTPVVSPPPPPPKRVNLLTASFRLLILGIGLAAIAGTALALIHPSDQKPAQPQKPQPTASPSPVPHGLEQSLQQGTRLTALEGKIRNLIATQSGLSAGLFFLNLDTGAYLDLSGAANFPAASTIKTPVLVAFFEDVDAGKIKLNEPLVMRKDLIASEAGIMQYQKPGTKFSALETADLMITISDNTATNMLIDRLGGAAALNQRFLSWGLKQTVIHNWLPDMKGTNTTSARDLAYLMMRVSQGELLSIRSRDRLLDIMNRTVTNTLLPQGLEEGARIAHKTGDIGIVIGDGGMIDMPNGQRYVAAVMVKRPYNDVRGRELIQQISRLTYQAFSKPLPPPSASKPNPSPSIPAATTASP